MTAEARPSTGSGRGEPAEPRSTQRVWEREIYHKEHIEKIVGASLCGCPEPVSEGGFNRKERREEGFYHEGHEEHEVQKKKFPNPLLSFVVKSPSPKFFVHFVVKSVMGRLLYLPVSSGYLV